MKLSFIKKLMSIVLCFNFILIISSCSNLSTGNSTLSKLTITGSTSVYPVLDYLKGAYIESRPNININLDKGGSGVGIKDARDGNNDIGMTSRKLKDSETGLVPYVIALDGIAVVLHPNNKVTDLTLENLKKIFNRQIINWKDVGGEDKKIVVITREFGSGTRSAFEEITGLDKNSEGKIQSQITSEAMVVTDSGQILSNVSTKENSIGYVSLGNVNSKVKTARIQNVECIEANIKNGSYPISRSLYLIVKNGNENKTIIKDFIDFILSDEGQKGVVDIGFIKVK